MEYKYTKIKSQRLAGFLMLKGFCLLTQEKDSTNNRNLFIFHQSDEIDQAVKKYNIKKQELLQVI